MGDVIGLLLWAMMLGFYLLPTLVAWLQQHHQLYAIAALNLLFGWTLLGWFGALIWAVARKEPPPSRKRRQRHSHHRKSIAKTQPPVPSVHSDLARRLDALRT